MDIKSGDIVQLKSGSEDMTVGNVYNDVACVAYFNFTSDEIVQREINLVMLKVVSRDPV